jgi:diaminopimelate decarboxylase
VRRWRRASTASTSNPPASWTSSTKSPAASAAAHRCRCASIPTSTRKPIPTSPPASRRQKFGVAFGEAFDIYRRAAHLPHIAVRGIDCHIGSQLLDPAPAAEAADKVLALVDRLAAAGIALEHIDLGGGMGIQYRAEEPAPPVADYLAPMLAKLAGRREKLVFEPGRSLVGNAGLLLTRVQVLKPARKSTSPWSMRR